MTRRPPVAVFVLLAQQGKPQKDIAEITGWSRGCVCKRLKRAGWTRARYLATGDGLARNVTDPMLAWSADPMEPHPVNRD